MGSSEKACLSLLSKPLLGAAMLAVVAPSLSACGGPSLTQAIQAPLTPEAASGVRKAVASSWTFSTLDNPDDSYYNALTGINNLGKIVGFTGNGSKSDPYKGFDVTDYGQGKFRNVNYPSAVDTVATSLNNSKSIAGYYVTTQGWIFGFIRQGGIYTSYKDPKLKKGDSNITELLGINDATLAVGFYTDEYGVDHAFELNATTGQFHPVAPPGGVSVEATGINGKGDIVGFMTTQKGSTSCSNSPCKTWLLKGGSYTDYTYPDSTNTQALAVNWQDQIVGFFVDSSGDTHGFVLSDPLAKPKWQQIDEPKAEGPTVVTSIQDKDSMVGYYQDSSSGYTNGFLATPSY
jgi:hypothetical protein